jgi:DNA polymerase-3 subunit alpha
MAFVTIEDTKGLLEVVVFADVFEASRQHLAADTAVLVEGTLDKGEETSKVIAKSISLLKKGAGNGEGAVYIELADRDIPEERIAGLRRLIRDYRGKSRVFLRVGNREEGYVTISLSEQMGVDPTNGFIAAVRELFVGGSVTVE